METTQEVERLFINPKELEKDGYKQVSIRGAPTLAKGRNIVSKCFQCGLWSEVNFGMINNAVLTWPCQWCGNNNSDYSEAGKAKCINRSQLIKKW